MNTTTIDVIVPTHKPDETFCLLLHHLQKQTFLIQKLIIINTGAHLWEEFIEKYMGGTKELLPKAKFEVEIIHINKSEFDHGNTRRYGVSHSNSEYFICMTQDAVPKNENFIQELITPFSNDTNIAAVYGRQIANKDCNEIEKFTRKFNYPSTSQKKSKQDLETLGIKTFFCSNVSAAYRRSIYDELGGFVTRAIFNEDMIFAGNAVLNNYYIYYAAEAKVIHSHNYKGIQQFKRNFDLAVSQKDHPEIFANVKSESEGIQMVKLTARHLLTIKKPWLILDLVIKSGFKLLGYKTGLCYKRLSRSLILKFTSNRGYWEQLWETDGNRK